MLISREFLTDYDPPGLGEDAKFFVVAWTESFGDGGDGGEPVGWIEDRTRVTDSAVLALGWALLLSGVADNGENPIPLARVRAFAVDPSEHGAAELDDLPGERVVFYVESDGTIVSTEDEEFAGLHEQTGDWGEIVKVYGEED
jgi:hypothetical protein